MTAPRRIAYVDLAPAVGGSVISLYCLVKGLDRRRYKPLVVLSETNPYAAEFRQLGIPVRSLACCGPADGQDTGMSPAVESIRRGWLVGMLKRSAAGERLVHSVGFWMRVYPSLRRRSRALARILSAWKPDLVHLNDAVAVSRVGIMAARSVGLPAICHLRSLATRNHYDRWISRSLRGCICISRAVDHHQRKLGGRTSPTWVVYNGLDLAEIDPADGSRVRGELGLSSDDQAVACIGRLVEWKGQRVFLRALARLVSAYPHLRALVVGAPQAGGEGYEADLRALTRELGLQEIVHLTGFRRDVPAILANVDILVHASTSPEPFGRVIIEGMAAGAVVVSADDGAVPEIVEHEVSGLLVAPRDVGGMARAISRLLDRPQQTAGMRRAARQAVERRFTMHEYVHGVERVYEELFC